LALRSPVTTRLARRWKPAPKHPPVSACAAVWKTAAHTGRRRHASTAANRATVTTSLFGRIALESSRGCQVPSLLRRRL